MKTELKTYTIRELVEGFTYSELEEKNNTLSENL